MAIFEVTLPLLLLVSLRDVILVQSAVVQPLQTGVSFLERYGYMAPPDPTAAKLISEIELREAIMKMQQFFHLPLTGQMDEETVEMMQKPRCGMPDLPQDRDTRYRGSGRSKRYSTQGTQPWRNFDLTYSFDGYTPDLTIDQVRDAIQRAFKVWSDVTPLTFHEITDRQEPDIHIDFPTGRHGDDYAFDGPGGTLAHAFFPGPGIGGDAHFDDDEMFTYEMHSGTNLFIVAAHELGHSLGLGHSDVEGALMAPFYQGYSPDFRLGYDDISGVQSLYGVNPNPGPRPPPRPRRPTLSPNQPETPEPKPSPTCTGGFGAVADIRSEVFIFKGDDMWRLSRDGQVLPGYPMPTETFWKQAPSSPDAVFEKIDGTITFVKGFKHWEFNGLDLKEGFPQDTASFTNNKISDVDSVLALRGDGLTYFFNGALCWRYDGNVMQMEDGYPRKISDEWKGGPKKVDAAFRFQGTTYLVQGNQYWKYSDGSMKADFKEPGWFTVDFLGCSLDTVVTEDDKGQNSNAPRNLYSYSIGVLSTLVAFILYR